MIVAGLPGLSPDAERLGVQMRQQVMRELMEYFRYTRKGEANGLRLSRLTMLIPPLQVVYLRLASLVELGPSHSRNR